MLCIALTEGADCHDGLMGSAGIKSYPKRQCWGKGHTKFYVGRNPGSRFPHWIARRLSGQRRYSSMSQSESVTRSTLPAGIHAQCACRASSAQLTRIWEGFQRSATDNVKRVRGARSLNYADLSRKLGELGRSISPLAVRRIEEGERRVDADDLMALSVALEVPPNSLLLPHSLPDSGSLATALPVGKVYLQDLWQWADGVAPIGGEANAETHAQRLLRRELSRPATGLGKSDSRGRDLVERMEAIEVEFAAMMDERARRGDG